MKGGVERGGLDEYKLSFCNSDSSSVANSCPALSGAVSVFLHCVHTSCFDSSSIRVPPLLSASDVTGFFFVLFRAAEIIALISIPLRTAGKRKERAKGHISFKFPFLSLFFSLNTLQCSLRRTGCFPLTALLTSVFYITALNRLYTD